MRMPEVRYIQLLPTYSYHDAIGNNVRAIDTMLRDAGHTTFVSAAAGDALNETCIPPRNLQQFCDPRTDVLIFHMSIGSEISYLIPRIKARKKVMIYHNITPSSYFCFDDDNVAEACRKGRRQVKMLKNCFDLAIGVSNYNADELKKLGYPNVTQIPLAIDFSHYDKITPSVRILNRYFDDKAHILFVGRGSPNKCQHDLVMAYWHFRKRCPDSRLLLAGGWITNYLARVRRLIDELDLSDSVHILGRVTDSELKALYLSSHLFLSMSEHEGFCVPLLESMHFGVPVMAFAAGAVPETMGDEGVLFKEKNHSEIVDAASVLIMNAGIRERIILWQRKRVSALADYKHQKTLAEFLRFSEGCR